MLSKGARVHVDSDTPTWETGEFPRYYGVVAVPEGMARVPKYRRCVGVKFEDGGFAWQPAYRVRGVV
jgi:hypothetical protein